MPTPKLNLNIQKSARTHPKHLQVILIVKQRSDISETFVGCACMRNMCRFLLIVWLM